MPMRTRTVRGLIAVAALLVALAAGSATALGALTVTGATLNGAASIATPPGGVVTAKVTAKATGGDTWRATSARVGSTAACLTSGISGGSQSFPMTAPGTPGTYDAGFTARSAQGCTGTSSPEFVLNEAVRVTTPAPNPNLPPRCGIDVMLVLDRSGSIQSSGATETVRNAARAFLNSLAGTGAQVSITDFSTTATVQVGYTTVTTETIASTFNPYLTNVYKPSGWTNWEDAFLAVKQANAAQLADLVVFITDGDPTARNNPPGPPITGLQDGDSVALGRAALEADAVKAQGSHVFVMGVGAAVTKPASATRLTAISGFDQYPATPFASADYTLVQDFEDLAKALQQIAVELCSASVTVTKLVDEGDGTFAPDPGWDFTATVATKPGSYTWQQPAPPPATGPRTQTTNNDGVATFQWNPANATATSTVSLTEQIPPGYGLVDWNCQANAPGSTSVSRTSGTTLPITVPALDPDEYARCVVRNRIIPGTIEIEKQATPTGATAFTFQGSGPIGAFTLVDDGGGESSSRTFTGLAPGSYTVSELVPAGWELTGVTCSDPSVQIAGAQVTISLVSGASVVCTYRDSEIVPPPVPPNPPNPPNPPSPPPVGPTGGPNTTLKVVKIAPKRAWVGDRVRFTLRVTNTGTVEAKAVTLVDVPPASLRLAGLVSGNARVIRGNAVWNIGTLQPGQSKTVRGSVRIKAGHVGIARNTVAALAENARLVQAVADTRVQAQVPVVPPVTG